MHCESFMSSSLGQMYHREGCIQQTVRQAGKDNVIMLPYAVAKMIIHKKISLWQNEITEALHSALVHSLTGSSHNFHYVYIHFFGHIDVGTLKCFKIKLSLQV